MSEYTCANCDKEWQEEEVSQLCNQCGAITCPACGWALAVDP